MPNKLINTNGNIKSPRQLQIKINYFDKLATQFKTNKKLDTYNSFYKRQKTNMGHLGSCYKDYHTLIVARPKNLIYLKLDSGMLALYKNKIRNHFNNVNVNNLHLNLLLCENNIHYVNLGNITPKNELAMLVNLLKYANINTLTINLTLNYKTRFENRFVKLFENKYIQQLRYLRQHIQKYCNDMRIIVQLPEINNICDFWKTIVLTLKSHILLISGRCTITRYGYNPPILLYKKTRYGYNRIMTNC